MDTHDIPTEETFLWMSSGLHPHADAPPYQHNIQSRHRQRHRHTSKQDKRLQCSVYCTRSEYADVVETVSSRSGSTTAAAHIRQQSGNSGSARYNRYIVARPWCGIEWRGTSSGQPSLLCSAQLSEYDTTPHLQSRPPTLARAPPRRSPIPPDSLSLGHSHPGFQKHTADFPHPDVDRRFSYPSLYPHTQHTLPYASLSQSI